MNINFELYRIFYVVARCGNISKAALELYISQPAVSKSIKKLEDELGGKIFKRTKKGVILTEEGKQLYDYVKMAMDYLNGAENKFKNLIKLETGIIRIGVNSTLVKEFLIPYLETFHNKYPKIIIKIFTGSNPELMSKLENGLIDLIILNLPFDASKDITIDKCKTVQDTFVVGKEYKHLIKKNLSLKDLNDYPLILQAKGSNTRNFLDKYCLDKKIILKSTMDLTSHSLVLEFTKIGFGIGYLTKEFIKDKLENQELFELKIKEEIPKRNIGIAYCKKAISFSTNELINIIKG